MRAQVTYYGGKSCWIDKYRFKLGIPLTVTNPKVVKLCQKTSGFTVEVLEEEKPKKVVRKVVKVSADDEPEEAPKRSLKKKTKASRRSTD